MIFIAVAWYIIGLIIFLTTGIFEDHSWDKYYYLWDKLKDVIFIAAILKPVPFSQRWAVRPIFYYSIIRVIWELISMYTGLSINNPVAVGVLFLMALTACLILMLKDLRKWWKQRRSSGS